MYTLYGNGMDDDTLAIQELLDSGVPQKHDCIGKIIEQWQEEEQ